MNWITPLLGMGAKAAKWLGLAGAAEYLTNKGDGKGGAITNLGRSAAETFFGEQSVVQGLNASLDKKYGTMAHFNGMIGGGLAYILDLVAMVYPPAGAWADACRDFATRQEHKMRSMNEKFQRGTTNLSLGEKMMNAPGKIFENPITAPTVALGGAAVALGGTSLGASAIASSSNWVKGLLPNKAPVDTKVPTNNFSGSSSVATRSQNIIAAKHAAGFGSAVSQTAGAAASHASTAASATGPSIAAATKSGGLLSKLPVVGKWFGAGAVVIGAGAALMPSDANAASPDGTTSQTTTQALGTEAAAIGASALGARAAVTAAAPIVGQLGLRAIPGVASVVAAGDTIYKVGGDVLRGEFKKAGLNTVAGAGEIVAGLGGAATYLTLGTAWREAVRGVGSAATGVTIEQSYVMQGVNLALGATSANAAEPASKPTVAAFKAAVENSPIVVAPKLVEMPAVDMMGNPSGINPLEPKALTLGMN